MSVLFVLLLLLLLRWKLNWWLMLKLCGSWRSRNSTSNGASTSGRRNLPCWSSTVIHYRPQIHGAVERPSYYLFLSSFRLLLCYCPQCMYYRSEVGGEQRG